MAQDHPVAALVVALTGELAPAVYSINRLRPECLCFVVPESAKALVETDVQPRISQLPRRWDWVLLSDAEHFPSCYQTISRSLPAMLRAWEIDPGALVVDMTGAGDLYSAGFLYGLTRGAPLEACGRLGSLAAAEVIGHIGARPEVSLSKLARETGLIG